MTHNTDEFDQDQYDAAEPQETFGQPKAGFWENVKNKPIVKLLVIMAIVGVALAGALGSFSSKPEIDVSQMAKAPSMNEAPGGPVTPFFKEQNDKANTERVGQALAQGGSAMPTPIGHDVADLTDNRKDPLVEFKAETERLKQEMIAQQRQNNQQMQMMQEQVRQTGRATQEDDSLAKAMQKQMQQLMESWAPRQGKFVAGVTTAADKAAQEQRANATANANARASNIATQNRDVRAAKPLVAAGSVNYVQLLTEANSDVPGPILAQILSGPLSGGRAIGRFQVMNDYLVMSFNTVSLKGKEYKINAMALDPDTTLGGMATDVDHRYFTRVLLPAAGAFVSAFGKALSETETETNVSDGTVVASQAKKGMKEALYSGVGEIGETMADFLKDEANKTKTLVRVAVGTPMGLFFLDSVQDRTE